MTCFWWQLTHDITVHIIRLPLKKGCFEINVEKIPTLLAAIWQLIRNPGLVDARESVCWLSFCLVLQTSQYPSGLCPEEVALLVSLDGEHPLSGHIVLRLDLPHNQSKTSLSTQDLY